MRAKAIFYLAVCLLLTAMSCCAAQEARQTVDLNGEWDFYPDTALYSFMAKNDEGDLKKKLPLDGQTYSTTLKVKIDCASLGYYVKALVRVQANADCDASDGAFIGVRVNGGAWVDTDISYYMNGQAHWIPVSVMREDLIKGDNTVEVRCSLRGKAYLMGSEIDGRVIPGIRLQYATPQNEWGTITVPGAFEGQFELNFRKTRPGDFDGVGYYRKMISLDDLKTGESWYLSIDASDYRTEVWLNERFIGSHEGGYTPFAMNLSAYPEIALPGEENELMIRVTDQSFGKSDGNDSIYIKETLAGFLQDTRGLNYGGIWGSVRLEKRASAYIEDVFFLPDVENGRVLARVTIANDSALPSTVTANVRVKGDADAAQQTVTLSAHDLVTVEIPVAIENAVLWTIDTPHLYTGDVSLSAGGDVVDGFQDTFGMRDVCVKDGKIHLNGENIFLTGVLHWGMYWDGYTPACTPERAEMEIKALKAAGFNSIKYCLYTPPDYILDLCDELGMYVYVEYPIWTPSETDEFFERCSLQMMEMVRKDRNHPSVIATDFSCEIWNFSFDMEELLKWCVERAKIEAPNRIYSDGSTTGQNRYGDFATTHPYNQQNGFDKVVEFYVNARNATRQDPVIYQLYGLPRVKSFALEKRPVIFGEYADTKVMRDFGALKKTVNQDVAWYYDTFGAIDSATLLRRTGLSEERIQEIIAASIENAQQFKRAYIEQSKRNSLMGGLYLTHMTDLQSATAFGMFDDLGHFRFDEAAFRASAGETALLLDTQSYNFWAGDRYTLGAEMSYYAAKDIENGRLEMTLEREGEIVERRTLAEGLAFDVCDYCELGDFSVAFPKRDETARYTLTLTLSDGERVLTSNSWNVWAYPKDALAASDNVYVNDPDNLYRLTERYPWMHEWTGADAQAKLLVTTTMDEQCMAFLKDGGRVIYLGAFEGPLSCSVNWNYDRSAMTFFPDEAHPIISKLKTTDCGGLQFNDLLTIGQIAIDQNTQSIVSKFSYESTVIASYVAMANVGEGMLMQSTLRHHERETALYANGNFLNQESMYRPAGENALGLYLLDGMIDFMRAQ